jgi:hypothetical protein
MSEQQTYANHRRFEPLQHFILAPILLVNLVAAFWQAYKHPSLASFWLLVMAFAFFLVSMQVRVYALKVQDRLIRLEESPRLERLLPEDLKSRSSNLSVQQIVGLRFASDAELPQRVREALDENLSGEQIKKRIQTWRPDTFRV